MTEHGPEASAIPADEIAALRGRFAEAMANPVPLGVWPAPASPSPVSPEPVAASTGTAEARLARIAAHCRERMNGPGRGGMSRAAAGIILGIAEGTYKEEARDGR